MGTIFHENISYSGKTGKGVLSVAKTSTSGLVDTYTMTYTDGSTYTYNVTNGKDGRDEQDTWTSPQTVTNGIVTFTGLDDTQGWGYRPFAVITSLSTNLNPSAELTAISGDGTASMSLTYETDADEGSDVVLRILK